MCNCYCNPWGDAAICMEVLKKNLQQVSEGKKTFLEALEDTKKTVAMLSMVIR